MPDSPLYRQAAQLLASLSREDGILASDSPTANYRSVFTRDAVMAGAAGLLVGERAVTTAFLRTLERLRDLQGSEGQIPSNYSAEAGGAGRVSFGTLAPRIDATSWYLMGVAWAVRAGVGSAGDFEESVRRAVRLLRALEFNERHLIWIPPGGNWADEFLTEGYVLFDQILRAWALRLIGPVYREPTWVAKADRIEATVADNYWPAEATRGAWVAPSVGEFVDPSRGHPLAAISPLGCRDLFDLASASLLGVSGVAPRLGAATLAWIGREYLDRSRLPPAFAPVIEETDSDYRILRRYHLYDFRNRPHEYHNGGIWPIWLGWLGLALARLGRAEQLGQLRSILESYLTERSFRFEEFLHGETGAPGGTAGMAYTATGLVFLGAAESVATARWLVP
jgi:hypothetical protein